MKQRRTSDALEFAESIAPLYASRPPLEAMAFFNAFGMARRVDNDPDGAALCYDISLMIATATGDTSPGVGVVYDNLASVRHAQKRWDAADAASDRALALLEKSTGEFEIDYAHALNNRAILLADEGDYTRALGYSERALQLLRKLLKADDPALKAFEEDNRLIKAGPPK